MCEEFCHERRRLAQEGVINDQAEDAPPPSTRSTLTSLAMLVAALVAVVGLAKIESEPIESAVTAVGSHSPSSAW